MSKKIIKWVGFFTGVFVVAALAIASPFIASQTFWKSYRENHADEYESLKYKIPENLGENVTSSAFRYADVNDYISKDIGERKRFQDQIEGTYVFVSGNDFWADWDSQQSFKGIIGLFEENIRWTLTGRGGNNPSAPYSSLGRFCMNVSKPNQTLKYFNDNFDFKVKSLDPKNVVTIVGSEYAWTDDIDASLNQFENDLRIFINNSLALRNNTSNVILMKHWKIPNPNNDKALTKFNNNVAKLNIRANRILSELTKDQIPRVLLIDNEDLFMNLNYQLIKYFDDNYNLSRVGSNEVAKNILAVMKPIVPTTSKPWTPENWTNFSKLHDDARPFEWNTLKSKNGFKIDVQKIVRIENNVEVGDLLVTFPEGSVKPNDKLKWILKFNNVNVRILDYGIVNSKNQLLIDNIHLYGNSLTNGVIVNNNLYTLTVYDANGKPFDIYEGDFSKAPNNPLQSNTLSNRKSNLSVAQQKFMAKFNNKNKPMVWSFIGDSIDHGANANQGFDYFPEVVSKSVKNDWKRYDDVIINAAQSGNFTNRAVDPFQIQSTITKYKPDVLSIGLGISDGFNGASNGQPRLTNEQQFIGNMKTLIDAAKKANPDVIVVVNAINPTNNAGRRAIPIKYNPYLKKAFEDNNDEYKDFVIYNEKAYSELNNILSKYSYTYNDQLFMWSDQLHPGGGCNLLKAKVFLESLGVDVNNSYLGNYNLEQFVPWTGQSNNKIGNINLTQSKNKIVPDITAWSNTLPMGSTSSRANNLANIFMKFQSIDKDRERTYYLETEYGIYNNKYWVMLEDGKYNVDAWAVSKTPLSASAQYAAKTPVSEVTVSNATK